MNDIEKRVTRCFSNVFPDLRESEIPRASMTSLAAWNSMAHVTLLSSLEEEFGQQFGMDEFDELVSYPLIVDHLENQTPTS